MSERGDITPGALLSESLLHLNEMRAVLVVWIDRAEVIHTSWSNLNLHEGIGILEVAKMEAWEALKRPEG